MGRNAWVRNAATARFRGVLSPHRPPIYPFIKSSVRGSDTTTRPVSGRSVRVRWVSAAIARLTDVPAGLLAGCDRLVHPVVVAPAERERQRRFIGAMLAAPFAAAAVFAFVPLTGWGMAGLLALLCGVTAIAWALAVAVSLTGRGAIAERASLGLAAIGVALAAAMGGMQSPLILLAAAIGFETYWVGRSARAALAGIAAALASLSAYILLSTFVVPGEAAASVWQWLPPALYAVLSWPRIRRVLGGGGASDRGTAETGLDSLFDLQVLKLSPAGEIMEATPAAAEALGVAPDLLTGSAFFERVHIGDRIAFMGALAELRQAPGPQTLETRLRVAGDGHFGSTYRLFELVIAAATEPEHLMLMLRGISELAELRRQVEQARDAADSSDLAKSRFLAAVGHELRTPLNSIIGFSDMLMHGMAGEFADARQRDYVGLIRQSGTHLLSVVNAILDVSKIESGAYSIRAELFAVKEAVDLCHSMMAQQAREKGLVLTARTYPDPGEISADRRAVQQIVLNLLTNAIKFTPSGGTVSVETVRSGPWLKLVVTDTGIGIAGEDLERIGQPFQQVRNDFTRQFDGAGLGLSLVKGLVKLHEGEMSIESAPGEGTVVTVSLPVAGPRNAEGDTEAAPVQRAALHRIGVGDPNETVRKTA